MQCVASRFLNEKLHMSEVTFCGHGKDVGLLEESQIIGMDQDNKTHKKITENTKIGIKIVCLTGSRSRRHHF